jgi:hypothetical protein
MALLVTIQALVKGSTAFVEVEHQGQTMAADLADAEQCRAILRSLARTDARVVVVSLSRFEELTK